MQEKLNSGQEEEERISVLRNFKYFGEKTCKYKGNTIQVLPPLTESERGWSFETTVWERETASW
jgi:hypothetical protein